MTSVAPIAFGDELTAIIRRAQLLGIPTWRVMTVPRPARSQIASRPDANETPSALTPAVSSPRAGER